MQKIDLFFTYVTLLDKYYDLSKDAAVLSDLGAFDDVILIIENRNRLENTISTIKSKMTSDRHHMLLKYKDELLSDLQKTAKLVDVFDQITIHFLNQELHATKRKLSETYKLKEKFKGYNLTDVR